MATFYRIVKNNPPTVEDFKSHAELGLPKPPNLPQRRWEGVSMSVDLERIRRRALRRPDMGAFLAELDIPDFVEREQVGDLDTLTSM